jgi:hypothetical protein
LLPAIRLALIAARQAWLDEFGVLDGVILHEPEPGPSDGVQADDPQLLQHHSRIPLAAA